MILQDNFYGAVVVLYLHAESHCEFHTAPGWPPIFWPNCSFWVIGPPVGCQFTHSRSPLLINPKLIFILLSHEKAGMIYPLSAHTRSPIQLPTKPGVEG